MRDITENELNEILYQHELWLKFKGGERANLSGVDLSGTDLSGAYLRRADLADANLIGADLSRTDLKKAKCIPYIPLACPEEGSFIGFKKALQCTSSVIIKLLILEDAKRSSGTGRKCRCSKAKVLDIQDLDGNSIKGTAFSIHDKDFAYEVGKVVEATDFDENRFNECAPGIHFFINRQEAVKY